MHPRSLLFAAALLAPTPALLAQGALTPPDAPAPTMKTLDQIEPRIPLRAGANGVIQNANGGFTISVPGSYYLTGNVTVATGDAIVISADNVTLDLGGFTIRSTTSSTEGTAILFSQNNVTLRNGYITSSIVINEYSGQMSGSGFVGGIKGGPGSSDCAVDNVHVTGTSEDGIWLGVGSRIAHCSARFCGMMALRADVITDSCATYCLHGIYGETVANCNSYTLEETAIQATGTATNCHGVSSNGIGIEAAAATNCSGRSGHNCGLRATTAAQCKGSSVSASGLFCEQTATNCHGRSSTGYGIIAATAVGCTGESETNTGLFANNATNCRGTSTSGTGLNTNSDRNGYTGTATDCTGISDTGHGLIASVATNCTGRTTDKSKIAVWVSGTATGCRGNNTGATGTGDQAAVSCTIAVACTATTGTIAADSKQLGTP